MYIILTLLAAQAIALAIRRVNGDVRVTLFEGDFYHAEEYNSEALFCRRLASLSMAKADGNDTSFAWLPVAWMKFPDHLHILLTDGEGELPLLIPEQDRKRTCAIVIPDGRPDLIMPVVGRLTTIIDSRILIFVGLVINAFAVYLMSLYNTQIDFVTAWWPRFIQGFGGAVSIATRELIPRLPVFTAPLPSLRKASVVFSPNVMVNPTRPSF